MRQLSDRRKWAMGRENSLGPGASPADLARAVKVSNATVNYWLNGINGMSAAKARLAAEFLEVDPIWLETGEGNPYGSGRAATGGRGSKESMDRMNSVFAYDSEDDAPDDIVLIPESRIEFAAGNGRMAMYELVGEEQPATYRRSWFQKRHINPERVRRFRVSGDSMAPMLFARDTILVNDDERTVIDGKLYAIRYGDELRVKYLSRHLDGTLLLRSVNPAYPIEEVPPELVEQHISIFGRVRDKSGTGGL
jgi:phage repressor protein C with HTH and peptisase S24 domain